MPFADFDAARREAVNEPVAFQLRGERFECLARCPAGDLFTLAGRGLTPASARDFIAGVVADDHLERFAKVLANKDDPVDLAEVVAITEWLVEVYTGRPTKPSTGSPAGRQRTGRTSKAASATRTSSH